MIFMKVVEREKEDTSRRCREWYLFGSNLVSLGQVTSIELVRSCPRL